MLIKQRRGWLRWRLSNVIRVAGKITGYIKNNNRLDKYQSRSITACQKLVITFD